MRPDQTHRRLFTSLCVENTKGKSRTRGGQDPRRHDSRCHPGGVLRPRRRLRDPLLPDRRRVRRDT